MTRFRTVCLFLFFVFLIYGLYLSQQTLEVFEPSLREVAPPFFHDYRGAINVHTDRSSGRGSYEEVIAAAQKVGLDFVFITDLNLFEKPLAFERYHDSTLVFVGGEYSYLDSRLLNILNQNQDELSGLGQSQVLINDWLNKKSPGTQPGLWILAHPLKKGYAWSGGYPPGLDGIEVINLKSVWQNSWERSRFSFILSLLFYPFHPQLALMNNFLSPRDELQLWDQLNLARPTLGFAGSDAEGRVRLPIGFDWDVPSYETLFGIVSNHVLLTSELTGQLESDRTKLSKAIRSGQMYMSLDQMGDPRGLTVVLKDRDRSHLIGARVPLAKGLSLRVDLGRRPRSLFKIQIFKNGVRLAESTSVKSEFAVYEPGAYRIMVLVRPQLPWPFNKKWYPWVITNPFYVEAGT